MVPDMGDNLAGHSPTTIPTGTEAAVSESTPCAPHLAITAACIALWLIDAPIITHAMNPSGIICTPSHTCHFSHKCHLHHSTDHTQSHSSNFPSHRTETQPRKDTLCPTPSTPHKPHHSKTVTIQDSLSDSSSDSDSYSDPLNY